MSNPRILFGFSYYQNPVDVAERENRKLARIRQATKLKIDSFCLTINPPGPRLPWLELDRRWKRGDKALLKLYENLARKLEDYDVLLNYNGINLHPDFLAQLSVLKVYACFDDPESSENLSKPVALSYDLCLVGNIAEVDTYRTWGVRNAEFWPLGFFEDVYDKNLTKEHILNGTRNVDITLICDKRNKWRKKDARLNKYVVTFPDGRYYGKGWASGFLPQCDLVSLYQRTKIGPNFHLSTGPCNRRTYALPANGVLQLCDNKSHLGKIFQLGKEVVGYDTIDECVDLTKYYLAHECERRTIAAAGWERTMKDYNEVSVFQKAVSAIKRVHYQSMPDNKPPAISLYLRKQRDNTRFIRLKYAVTHWPIKITRYTLRVCRKLLEHIFTS